MALRGPSGCCGCMKRHIDFSNRGRPDTASESRSYPELKSPRASRGENLAKRRRSEERIGQIVIHTIGGVEHFGAQIELATLAVPQMLHDGQVQVRGRGAAKCVAPARAEGAERRHGERPGVEPRLLCAGR